MQRRREARHASELSGVHRINDVQHRFGRHPYRFTSQSRIGDVTGVAAQEVVGHASADAVELDALADAMAILQQLVVIERQHLCRQHLQLQRDCQAVFGSAWARLA